VKARPQARRTASILYRHVLEEPLPWLDDVVRALRPLRLLVVLAVDEVRAVIDGIPLPSRLVATLLYGSGLRLLEALTLRVRDVDFERGQVPVRDPKSKHDRVTMLPRSIVPELHEQLLRAHLLHEEDLVPRVGAGSGFRTRWRGSFPPHRLSGRDRGLGT
jgi:integrase